MSHVLCGTYNGFLIQAIAVGYCVIRCFGNERVVLCKWILRNMQMTSCTQYLKPENILKLYTETRCMNLLRCIVNEDLLECLTVLLGYLITRMLGWSEYLTVIYRSSTRVHWSFMKLHRWGDILLNQILCASWHPVCILYVYVTNWIVTM